MKKKLLALLGLCAIISLGYVRLVTDWIGLVED